MPRPDEVPARPGRPRLGKAQAEVDQNLSQRRATQARERGGQQPGKRRPDPRPRRGGRGEREAHRGTETTRRGTREGGPGPNPTRGKSGGSKDGPAARPRRGEPSRSRSRTADTRTNESGLVGKPRSSQQTKLGEGPCPGLAKRGRNKGRMMDETDGEGGEEAGATSIDERPWQCAPARGRKGCEGHVYRREAIARRLPRMSRDPRTFRTSSLPSSILQIEASSPPIPRGGTDGASTSGERVREARGVGRG